MDERVAMAPNLASRSDFALGAGLISPSSRSISGPGGTFRLEPKMMSVLLCLAEKPNRLVTRADLIQRCWHGTAVGDDSINRVVAGIRRAARSAGLTSLIVETLSGAGYRLIVDDGHGAANSAELEQMRACQSGSAEALLAGWRSWRLDLPQVDQPTLDMLREAVNSDPRRADVLGMLALLLREAVEYAEPSDSMALMLECETVAARALQLDPQQGLAAAALELLAPIYGNWLTRRKRLLDLIERDPGNIVALHGLAVLEMATGRPSAAVPLVMDLLERDPLATIFHYKRIYHLWTQGQLAEADAFADNAYQLWPTHPAIWTARFTLLAFTGRTAAATRMMMNGGGARTPLTRARELTLRALQDGASLDRAVQANLEIASMGPVSAVAALTHLSGLGEADAFFELAEAYYLNRGALGGIVRTELDGSVTDQHRRITQLLFTPAAAAIRKDARFLRLCDSVGLTNYWRKATLVPDFMANPLE